MNFPPKISSLVLTINQTCRALACRTLCPIGFGWNFVAAVFAVLVVDRVAGVAVVVSAIGADVAAAAAVVAATVIAAAVVAAAVVAAAAAVVAAAAAVVAAAAVDDDGFQLGSLHLVFFSSQEKQSRKPKNLVRDTPSQTFASWD